MHHDEEQRLIDKLKLVETLFARTNHAGERAAAGCARDRILQRLEQLQRAERPVEFRFSLPDVWSRALLLALLRRYGIEPYRYRGQRRTTVIAKVTRTFVDEVLSPEFQQLNEMLREHLHSVTQRVIAQAFHADLREAEERVGEASEAQGLIGAE